MSISLNTLRRDVALVVACLLGSAGTFLAISQATHQPVTGFLRAVFTPSADQLAPWPDPATGFPKVRGAVVLEPGIAPWDPTPGKFYVGSDASNPVNSSVWLLPAILAGSDLPGGTVIRVRTAAGTIENCTHTTGSGYSTDGLLATADGWVSDGVPVTGDGWTCSRLSGWVSGP